MTTDPNLPWTVVAAQRDEAVQLARKWTLLRTERMTYGGGFERVGTFCRECNADWNIDQPERHFEGCALARIAELGKIERRVGKLPGNQHARRESDPWDGKTERRGGQEMTIIRYPFPAELDAHEAAFETEEGELVAGLAHLNSLAVPAGEPRQSVEVESIAWPEVGLVLIVICVALWAALGYLVRDLL